MGRYGPGVKLTLSMVAEPRTPALWEHSNMPTVAEAGIVGSDLLARKEVQFVPSGETYAVKLAPDRTSFIQMFGKA